MKRGLRLALVAAAIVALVLLVRLLPVARWLESLEGVVRDAGPMGPLLFALAYVAAVLLFVPGSVLTLAAGALFGLVRGTLVAWLGATVGAALAFLIARHLARGPVERLAQRDERFGAVDQAIREGGWRIVALLRLSPVVPFSLSNYLYGLTPVRFVPYVLASAVAMLPGTLLYVSLGAAGRAAASGAARSPWEWALIGVGIAATIVATVMITRSARRRLRSRA